MVAVVGQQEELESGNVTFVGSDSSVPDLPHFSIENWAKSDSLAQELSFPSDFSSGLKKKVWMNEGKAEAWNSLPPVSISGGLDAVIVVVVELSDAVVDVFGTVEEVMMDDI